MQIESQRQVQQQAAAEAQARSRVAKVQTDLEQRTAALERQAAAAGEAGRLIEAHADAVDAAILAVNGQLATGMAWTELERCGSAAPPLGLALKLLVLQCLGCVLTSGVVFGACERDREIPSPRRCATRNLLEIGQTLPGQGAAVACGDVGGRGRGSCMLAVRGVCWHVFS